MVAGDEFLEYATVFSYFYGTPKSDVMAALERGEDVLFDIDWQGTQQVANAARTDLVSFSSFRRRARRCSSGSYRAQDSADVVAERMARPPTRSATIASMTISSSMRINASVDSVRAILSAERLRRDRQSA